MYSVAKSTTFVMVLIGALIVTVGEECDAQYKIGDASVDYSLPTGGWVAADCHYFGGKGTYTAQAVAFYAKPSKGRYSKGAQYGLPVQMSPSYNNVKNYYDYSGSGPLWVGSGAFYIVEIQVDYGDGLGFQVINGFPYTPQ